MIKVKNRQSLIAEKTGVSQGTISNWLNLKSKPTGLAKKALKEHFPQLYERLEAAWLEKNSSM